MSREGIVHIGAHRLEYVDPLYRLRIEGEVSGDEVGEFVKVLIKQSQGGVRLALLLVDATGFTYLGPNARRRALEELRRAKAEGLIYRSGLFGLSKRAKSIVNLLMRGFGLVTGEAGGTHVFTTQAEAEAYLHAENRG